VISDVGDATSEMLIDVAGNMTIAGNLTTLNPAGTFPDYVFSPDYPLMSLADLAAFVARERHLPNLPSAEEVEAKGSLDVTRLQMLLLEKVEELTLYTLGQHKLIEQLERANRELQSRLAEVESAVNEAATSVP
jgi:hypothetical protein